MMGFPVNWVRTGQSHRGAALVIVLAFVVLLATVVVAYLSRTSSDRQTAHGDFHDAKSSELARSALDLIVADLKQEIVDGSTAATVGNYTIYTPTNNTNMVPMRSGNLDPIPNLVRRSVRSDSISPPGITSRASAVNSATNPSLDSRSISAARWNKHFLLPKANTSNEQSDPIASFVAPDWTLVTASGPKAFGAWDATVRNDTSSNFVIGRYAYGVYDEAGLLDLNIAGYPTGTTSLQSGRKGSVAYADLTALPFPLPNPSSGALPLFQVDRLVGWRNYATTQPSNSFPGSTPPAFADNFQTSSVPAKAYFTSLNANSNGFLASSGNTWKGRTDQSFVGRQELINYFKTTLASVNALQYFGTFSRTLNAPSFTPATATTTNPDFMRTRVTTSFTRLDSTSANIGEPLIKHRFALNRLAWITYKGPSATLASSDPVITELLANGIASATIQSGTAANIQAYFGLTYVSAGLWTYAHGNPSRILRLDEVGVAARDPDFFEILQAAVLDGSLGQNTNGGVTGGATVFPDIHMSNKTHHILSIGAAIVDQFDSDSIPTRIQFNPSGSFWTAYGVESLPYITQIYPISGISPVDATKWATYLLFQIWNPHIGLPLSPAAPTVRLRVDGDIGVFTSGNGQVYDSGTDPRASAVGQSVVIMAGSLGPGSTPTPITTSVASAVLAAGSATAPCGFETLPAAASGTAITNYVGLRLLPDYSLHAAASGSNRPQVTLQFGADTSHRFNATLECDAGGGTWVPYNHFIGINDSSTWMNGAAVPVRTASSLTGLPSSSNDQFNTGRFTQAPPNNLLKADPRSTRFGPFQLTTATTSRITQSLWPSGQTNGYGGAIADPAGPVAHAPARFSTSGLPYFPATLCQNTSASTASRTSYSDNDGVLRPADAAYPDPSTVVIGSSTPYYATSVDYHPIVVNRPFRNTGELGYAFRDLPWKTLDFFSDTSADAALLDTFCISEEPDVSAGRVSANTRQFAVLQSILAGAILDELSSTNAIFNSGGSDTSAPTIATNIVAATSASPLRNCAELITRSGLPISILPVPTTGSAHDQRVKARREVVARALAPVTQTRTWNLMIDVIAQSGRYPPTAAGLADFIVEGEHRYWLHVAIDRFTGEVVDQQLEAVYE
jgi:hypothetical protein